jgi:hypothetical protein
MGQIGCPETSSSNYQSTLRIIPEERRSYLHHGESEKLRNYPKLKHFSPPPAPFSVVNEVDLLRGNETAMNFFSYTG